MVRRLSSSRKWPLSLRAIRERLARDHIHTLVAHEDVVDGLDKGLIVEQLRIVGEVWLSSVSLLVCTLRAVRVCHCLMGSTHCAELAQGRGWQRLMGTTQACLVYAHHRGKGADDNGRRKPEVPGSHVGDNGTCMGSRLRSRRHSSGAGGST